MIFCLWVRSPALSFAQCWRFLLEFKEVNEIFFPIEAEDTSEDSDSLSPCQFSVASS